MERSQAFPLQLRPDLHYIILPAAYYPYPFHYLGVLDKLLEAVNEVSAIEWITTNSYHSRLTQTLICGLEHSLGGEQMNGQISEGLNTPPIVVCMSVTASTNLVCEGSRS